ncbi:hypothetical protein BDN67DRAFT_975886 [Paxillus ammoniavirescens]|nr:hypothetical protein BDN67DRAFT_975886 [Paxillus ammoniavirescens]
MLCGKWETHPREFAKCRRCRKARIVARSVRVTRGARDLDFCAVRKTETKRNILDTQIISVVETEQGQMQELQRGRKGELRGNDRREKELGMGV